jgi:prepilin-type N-terminal cleavage/methylation domain-containing protein
MMISHSKNQRLPRQKRGFTLIEVAIVLSITGILLAGLWRIISGSNQQMRDQSAAAQQQQLIAAVKGILADAQGQAFMQALGANGNTVLSLPVGNFQGGTLCGAGVQAQGLTDFCKYLPSNFNTAATNSYGQTFSIQVQRDNNIAGTVPLTYSFIIVASGGPAPIPDTSGGRIAAAIGGDGGFVYTNAVCNAAPTIWACGAYGTWSAQLTGASPGYGFAAGNYSGSIASRTYVSPSSDNTAPWLARPLMASDVPSPNKPFWNTMLTDLYLGGKTFWLGTDSLNFPTTGGGSINLQGGSITGGGASTINVTGTGTGGGAGGYQVNITGSGLNGTPQLTTSSGCLQATPGNPVNCPYSLQITGDITTGGLVNANAYWAQTFTYVGSDIRLKSNIRPITDALTDIMKLKPVSFTFKSNGKESLGVIAQDLEKIYPQLVSQGAGMKSVSYEGLIGPLIAAVQELKKENDTLREQLHTQEQRQKVLEQKLQTK